jgi:hypothetical protein
MVFQYVAVLEFVDVWHCQAMDAVAVLRSIDGRGGFARSAPSKQTDSWKSLVGNQPAAVAQIEKRRTITREPSLLRPFPHRGPLSSAHRSAGID